MPNTAAMGTWAHDPVFTVVLVGVMIAIRVFHLISRREAPGQDSGAGNEGPGPRPWWGQQSSIGSLPDGAFGRIVGSVRVHERSLVSPLTRRPCVWYAVV